MIKQQHIYQVDIINTSNYIFILIRVRLNKLKKRQENTELINKKKPKKHDKKQKVQCNPRLGVNSRTNRGQKAEICQKKGLIFSLIGQERRMLKKKENLDNP